MGEAILTILILTCLLIQASIFIAWVYKKRHIIFLDKEALTDEAKRSLPGLSVIIPAHNEEKDLGKCLLGVVANNYPNLQVIVVDDRSTDKTPQIASEFANSCPTGYEIKIITNTETPHGWAGKNYALNKGFEASSGEYILFLDADTMPKAGLLDSAVNYMVANQVDMLTIVPQPIYRSFWDRLMNAYIVSLGVLVPPKQLNDPHSRKAMANGPFMLFRRSAYQAIGGHKRIRGEFWEDTILAEKIKASGYRFAYLFAPSLMGLKLYTNIRDLWRGWQKIEYRKMELGRTKPVGMLIGSFILLILTALPAAVIMAEVTGIHDSCSPPVLFMAGAAYFIQALNLYFPHLLLGIRLRFWTLLGFLGGIMVCLMEMETALRFIMKGKVNWKGLSYKAATRMLKAYILKSDKIIEPLGDEVSRCRVLNRELIDYQRETLSRLGIKSYVASSVGHIRGDEPYILIYDHVFITEQLLRLFLRDTYGSSESLRLGVRPSAFTEHYTALQDLEYIEDADGNGAYLYDVFYIVPDCESAIKPLIIKLQEKVFTPPNLKLLAPDADFSIPITPEGILHIEHWMHITDANHLAMQGFHWRITPRTVIKGLLAVFRGFSFNPWRVMGRYNYRGRGCRIHPTASVEACVLGDNVEIGAHSVIRGSFIGDNVKIDSNCDVSFSVIGDNCVVAFHTKVNFSVLYPSSLVSSPGFQCALIGKGAVQTSQAILFDMLLDRKLQKTIKVMHKDRVIDSGRMFLGPCLGHGATVGGGVFINPGVVVPNGVTIVKEPGEVLTRQKKTKLKKGIYIVKDGELVSIEQVTGSKSDG